MNHVAMIGHVTKDLELRYLANGDAVVSFQVALNERWTTKDGQKKERASFVTCVAWRNRALTLSQYVRKGSKLAIEGKLVEETWEKDGERRSKLTVQVERSEFLDPPSGDRRGTGTAPAAGNRVTAPTGATYPDPDWVSGKGTGSPQDGRGAVSPPSRPASPGPVDDGGDDDEVPF